MILLRALLLLTQLQAFLLLFWAPSRAALVNVTVDDSGSDPITDERITYSTPGWQTSASCEGCGAHPDVNGLDRIYGGTWHDSTYTTEIVKANFKFQGTAIFVFCIVANGPEFPEKGLSRPSDMSFYINGTAMGKFIKDPQQVSDIDSYDYNVTVFEKHDLPPGLHNLTIQNGHQDGPRSLMLLDAIAYTYDDGNDARSDSGNKSSLLGPVLGGVLGGGSALLVAATGLFIWRRRKWGREWQNHENEWPHHDSDPYSPPAPRQFLDTVPGTRQSSDVKRSALRRQPQMTETTAPFHSTFLTSGSPGTSTPMTTQRSTSIERRISEVEHGNEPPAYVP